MVVRQIGLLWAIACLSAPFAKAEPPDGFAAGDVVVRLAAAGVVPLTSDSHIDTLGGSVGVTATPAPELDLTYFLTKAISLEAIAASTRHEISANDTTLSATLGPKIDLASAYVLPPAIVAQYHVAPQGALDPYVGIGIDLLFPYDVHENRLTLPGIGQVVRKVGLSNAVGPVFDLGLNYHLAGPWFINIDYKQIIDRVDARVQTALGLVKAKVDLNPAVVSAGVEYRF